MSCVLLQAQGLPRGDCSCLVTRPHAWAAWGSGKRCDANHLSASVPAEDVSPAAGPLVCSSLSPSKQGRLTHEFSGRGGCSAKSGTLESSVQ